MNKQLFLTSSVHAVASNISSKLDLRKNNKLIFIDTAAEPEKDGDISWLINDRKALVDAGFDVSDYTISNKSKIEVEEEVSKYDYIYMSGGDTLHLLEQAQKCDFHSIVKDQVNNKGKTYIGTSAGSIAAAPKPHDYYYDNEKINKLDKHKGFNLVNFILVPHWGSPDFKEIYIEKRLELAYSEDYLPMIILSDYQYVHVINNSLSIIDVRE